MCIKWKLTKEQQDSVLSGWKDSEDITLYKVVRRRVEDGRVVHRAICTGQEYIEGLNIIDEDVIVHRYNMEDNYKIGIHLFRLKRDAEEVADNQIKRDAYKDIVVDVTVKKEWITVIGETEHERKKYVMIVAQQAVFPEMK